MKMKIMTSITSEPEPGVKTSISYLVTLTKQELQKFIIDKAKQDEELHSIVDLDKASVDLVYVTLSLIPDNVGAHCNAPVL